MRVRAVQFKSPVRTGPESHHRLNFLNVLDEQMMVGVRPRADEVEDGYRDRGYFVGTIDVYYGKGPEGDLPGGSTGERYIIIRSPRVDRQTGEPLITVIDAAEGSCEPLSDAMAIKVYGVEGQWMFRPEPTTRAAAPEAKRAERARPLA